MLQVIDNTAQDVLSTMSHERQRPKNGVVEQGGVCRSAAAK